MPSENKMAEISNDGGKVQIVFLVDEFFKQLGVKPLELEEICQLRCKAISLCVLRLLLHFNASVGCSDRKKSLSWGFKFFNSRILNFECKRRRFYDLDSHSFEKFEEELKERSENVCNLFQETGSKSSKQNCTGAKALSCSFTEILHDFSWITLDISSPFRNGKDNHLNDVVRNPRNLLFVIGDCPQDNRDLQCFIGEKEVYNEVVLMKEIFSQALEEEFRKTCNLSLFWIDTGLWCLAPEKMGVLMKDWDGYKMMTAITKQLNGNMIPISSLTQNDLLGGNPLNCVSLQQNLKPNGATTSKPCDETCESANQPELYNRVLQAKFGISFCGVVQAFLNGKDLTGMDILTYALSVPSRSKGLFHGFLYFKGDEKICHIQLTQMINEQRNKSSVAIDSQQPCSLMVNISKKTSAILEKSPLLAAENGDSVDDPSTSCQSRKSIDFCIKMDKESENEAMVQDAENAFFIKGVISCGSVPPSWLHPTKLFSCLEWGKHHSSADGSAVSEALCSSGLLQKLLLLISSKGLNLVVEFYDPETCVPLIGLLQPVTSVCAILSVVKTEMLLMIEKLLLSQKSHGCILVSHDVTVVSHDVTTNDVTNPLTLSVEVCENIQLSSSGLHNDLVLKGVPSNQTAAKASDHLQKNNVSKHLKETIVDSFIRNIGCKQQSKRKNGKEEILLQLRNYYSKKQGRQAHERNEESTVNEPLTRGRLCQDTSVKNKATSNQETKVESNSKHKGFEEPDDHVISSGLDSEMTDAMEIDEKLPNLSDILTVDDFKVCLEEDYQKCVNLDHSAAVFVTHAFIMIDRLKSSGELKDMNHIMTVLKSCVLRDNKSLREIIEKRGDIADKDKIVQEYKLQVYLRLELADKIAGVDQESLADEITEMLRAISFQKHPTYLSSFLKNSVIARYAGNLSTLLCHVYDGLMLRPPTEILSPSQISSEEDTPLKSHKVSSVSMKSESVEETKNTRTLVRRHSVMGVPDRRREIVVPVKVKHAKNSERTTRSTSSGRKQSSSKASATKKSVTPVKRVRRNLFKKNADGDARRTSPQKAHKMNAPRTEKDKLSRRHSFASFSRSKKVADTPVCKQVSKRMLHRQEWARRVAKTVTDVTVIGESPLKDEVVRPFPRKSPRRRAATFYSSSSHTSLASKSTTTSISKAPEQSSEDLTRSKTDNSSKYENSGTTSSATATFAVDGESSSREQFQRSLSIKKPESTISNNAQIDESFVEVFMDTEEATSQTVVPTQSSGDPKKSPLRSSRIPFTSHLVPSVTVLTRRSKSSPSLSQSSPTASRVSPSDHKRPLNASTSFPSTSPFCKSRSIDCSAEQIFDIAIPLTPVKTDHIKSFNFGSITTDISPRRCPTSVEKRCFSPATANERIARVQCSPSPGTKRPFGDRSAQLKPGNQANIDESDSDGIVVASPQLDRKRSLLSRAEPSTSKTILTCLKNVEVFKQGEFVDDSTGKGTTDETNGGCSTVSCGDRQRSGYETLKQNSDPDPLGDLEQSEVFTSPVATRRKRPMSKREHTSGNVSPLNQILKQRKNHRTPPGSSREAVSKPENKPSSGKKNCLKSTSMDKDNSSLYPKMKGKINLVKIKRPFLKECDEYEKDRDSVKEANTLHNSSRTDAPTDCSSDEAMSSEKTNSPSSHSARNRHLGSTSPSCSLLPHFTPTALSAWSLKHLEESPVLLHPSSQSPDCPASSLARKWSERSSPRDTSRLTLRKRLRHDS